MHNIPVLSYLALGGRCASCRAPISMRYPLVELATADRAFAVVAWHFGFGWQAALALVFSCVPHRADRHRCGPPVAAGRADAATAVARPAREPLARSAACATGRMRDALIGAAAGYLVAVGRVPALPAGHRQGRHGLRRLQAVRRDRRLARLADAAAGAAPLRRGRCRGRHRADRRAAPRPRRADSFRAVPRGRGWIAMLWGLPIIERYLGVAGLR